MGSLFGVSVRHLILSDIHANLAAMEAVLPLVKDKYEEIVCLGDIVGYGPDANEAVDCVRELKPMATVRGNHDKAGCGITDAEDFNPIARAAALWTREQLREENLEYLRELAEGPDRVGGYQIVHGSIRDEDEYLFRAREARENLELAETAVTFFGHTHFQGGFLVRGSGRVELIRLHWPPGVVSAKLLLANNARYLINPGSIGQPRDGDPRAGFAFYDGGKHTVEFWRVPYDVDVTQEKMRKAELPPSLIDRLALGR
jgi:predicted phosphodiesterase